MVTSHKYVYDWAKKKLEVFEGGPLRVREKICDQIVRDAREVVIHERVREIRTSEFEQGFNIEKVTLPKTLATIGTYCFQHAPIENVVIKRRLGINNIGYGAFENVKGIEYPTTNILETLILLGWSNNLIRWKNTIDDVVIYVTPLIRNFGMDDCGTTQEVGAFLGRELMRPSRAVVNDKYDDAWKVFKTYVDIVNAYPGHSYTLPRDFARILLRHPEHRIDDETYMDAIEIAGFVPETLAAINEGGVPSMAAWFMGHHDFARKKSSFEL